MHKKSEIKRDIIITESMLPVGTASHRMLYHMIRFYHFACLDTISTLIASVLCQALVLKIIKNVVVVDRFYIAFYIYIYIIWNRMTASVLKQDPNTKKFKRTLTYFDTTKNSVKIRYVSPSHFSSFFNRLSAVYVSFWKGIYPKICILCVRVKINKRSFEPFCVWLYLRVVSLH